MLQLFLTFLYIGLFTIGGGYAMIPLIQKKVVDERKWLNEQELTDLIAVAQSSPGVFAVNLGVLIGYRLRRIPGALMSAIGVCLPSFVIILAIALLCRTYQDNVWVRRAFQGLRPAVVAMIAVPVLNIARTTGINRHNVWIPIVAALAIWLVHVSPVYVILIAGVGGYAYGMYIK